MDYLFNSFKIKYVIMNKLFGKLDLKTVNSITLYINLESVINALHRNDYEEALQTFTKDEINGQCKRLISNIINLAAHYRLYFTRSKVSSNIVFYYQNFDTYKNFYNSLYLPKYRKHYFDMYHNDKYELVNDIIISCVSYVKSIIDCIDAVYILKSDIIESSLIPLIGHKDKRLKSDLNIVLTKDLYDLQYVNHGFLVMLPEKEESVILHKKNVMSYLRYKHDLSDKYKVDINPLLLPFMLSVLGDKKRSLEKIRGIGFKKLYKSLEKLYEEDYLDDDNPLCFNLEHLSELIKESSFFIDNGVKETISANYMSINLDRQINLVDTYVAEDMLDGLINKFDNNGLKRINDKIFADYPLNIVELNNYNKNIFKDSYSLWEQ